ncbi:MAG: aromatic ring-hydroxylating dioxygenase subunit alpha [Methanobacteriota archaeon]|nr:MAG: aromatic ring-hydroxylating dioxygenase subunit alpha [Euryarchaeota archaeon]
MASVLKAMERHGEKYVGREDGEHLSARTPPGSFYTDEPIFRRELEEFFCRGWLNLGREEDLANPGDFFTREIGGESILAVRGTDGQARAFYNVCRHRGTRLVDLEEGTKLRSIVCPYHGWTYSAEGRLVGAPHTDGLIEFSKEDSGLYEIRLESWGGFLWANMDAGALSLRDEFGRLFAKFDRFPLDRLRRAARHTYEVNANWKILVENYQECYHCAPVHPDLNRITPYFSGKVHDYFIDGASRSPFSGGYMEFAKDYTSMTWSGYTKRPLLQGMTEEDRRRVYYYAVFPNLFFSLHPDFLMIHRTWPVTPTHSRVECDFFFDPATMARPDFDPSDAVGLWDVINRQDWAVCERSQKGMRSRVWRGGRYTDQEPQVYDFDRYVRERLGLS